MTTRYYCALPFRFVREHAVFLQMNEGFYEIRVRKDPTKKTHEVTSINRIELYMNGTPSARTSTRSPANIVFSVAPPFSFQSSTQNDDRVLLYASL